MTKTKKGASISEASRALGISKDAIRKRIKRGTIEAYKDDEGRWQVILDVKGQDSDLDNGVDSDQDTSRTQQDERIKDLKEQVDFLQQEIYRKDTIIMNLTEGIKLLEPPKKQRRTLKKWFFGD